MGMFIILLLYSFIVNQNNRHTRLSATHLLGSPDGSRNPLAANSTGTNVINIASTILIQS